MIIKDESKGIGVCPVCGRDAYCEDGDCIDNEKWESYHCNACGTYFSEKFEVKYLGFEINQPEVIECCPHCGHENIIQNWNVRYDGWVIHCLRCGEKLLLCDECMMAEDNKEMKCDWCDGTCFRGTTTIKDNGMCFRGIAKNRENEDE